MKILTAIMVLAFFAIPSGAQAFQPTCEQLSSLAGVVMTGRQDGVAMSDYMAESKDFPASQAIVVAAYKVPRYSTDEYKKSAVSDFENEWYLACYKSQNK